MEIKKGKYEVFVVGEERVFSSSRERIKQYAKKNNIEKIEYKMSFDNKEGAEEIAKEV